MENESKKIGLRVAAGVLFAVTIIFAVFASGIPLPSQEVKTGRLIVLLTDAPVELEQLMITITDLEVHKVGQEDGEDGEWITLLEDEEITFDLLDYQDGRTLELADVDIEEGIYNKIRMNVSAADAYYPEDSTPPVSLSVPPDKIDVITEFELESDETEVVTIDMEPDWVAISESNNLRPVLKAIISEDIQETDGGGE